MLHLERTPTPSLRPGLPEGSSGVTLALVAAGTLGLLSACAPTARQVPVNPADTTPATVRLTSINLLPEFGIGASVPQSHPGTPSRIESVTTFPEGAGFDGASPNPEAVVVVKASDPESGVQGVELSGRISASCSRAWQDPLPARPVVGTLPPARVGDPQTTAAASTPQPAERSVSMTLRHAEIRALCAGGVLTDFEITLEARATNGAGRAVGSSGRVVRPVSVVAHNMNGPALIAFGLDRGLNDRLDQWGRYFAQQDIVLLNEASRPEWVARMQLSMPDHAVAHFGSVAVLSRWPLTGSSSAATPPVCVTDLDGTVLCGINAVNSQYTRALAMTPRGPIDVLSLHWQHRPVPVTSHPSRVAFAEQIASALLASDWAIAGGDFNSKSAWIASEDPELIGGDEAETARLRDSFASLAGRSQPEIAVMERSFKDARREVWENDRSRWSHGFPWPVDHVFLRGGLNAVQYSNNLTGMPPGSDHPTIRVMVLRR